MIGGNLPTGDNTWIFMAVRFCKPEQSSKRGFTCWKTESLSSWHGCLSKSATFERARAVQMSTLPQVYITIMDESGGHRGICGIGIIGCYNPSTHHLQTGHVVHLRWDGEVLLCRSGVRIGSHDQPEMTALGDPTGSSHGWSLQIFEDTSWVVILKTNFKSVAWCKWFNFRLPR